MIAFQVGTVSRLLELLRGLSRAGCLTTSARRRLNLKIFPRVAPLHGESDLRRDGEDAANALGLAVYKVGMVWPLEADRIGEAVEGVEEVVVVEERRAVIELQLKELSYNWPADRRPMIVGKRDEAGRALVYTPNPVAPGSSVSHWDTSAFPNQLMEPSINADLTQSVEPPQDMTLPHFRDIGWFPDADTDGFPDAADACDASIQTPTVVIDGCDSGAPNLLLTTGCTISDEIAKCAASANNHGQFVQCVSAFTNQLKKAGLLTNTQKEAIRTCAENADIP